MKLVWSMRFKFKRFEFTNKFSLDEEFFWIERFDCVNFMLLPVFTEAYDLNLDFSRPLR